MNRLVPEIRPISHAGTLPLHRLARRRIQRHVLAGALLGLALWLGSAPGVHALSSDRSQPINIKADRVRINENKGFSKYSGHVVLTQGSIVLTAARLTVYQSKGTLQRIKATGAPARFKQLPDNGKTPVVASAEHMEYLAGSALLLLSGRARVTQGGNVFSGHRIEYDTRHSIVTARKNAQNGTGRVHAIIQPATTPPGKADSNTPAGASPTDSSPAR